MFLDNQLLIWLALILPFVGTALVPVFAKAGKKPREFFAVIVGFLTAAMALLLLPEVWFGRVQGLTYSFNWAPSIGLAFTVYIDPLAVMMAVIAGGIGSLVLLYSVKYMEGNEGLTRYYALVLLFIGSMIGLVFVDNLLVLYFFWEAVGLCSYALIGFYTKDPKAAKAGIKALVTTRVGDIALLIGIFALAAGVMKAMSVGFWDSLSIQFLIQHLSSIPTETLTLAGFCFLIGALGKSAQIPLHVWLPDAMEAPTTISALIHAATMVNAGVYLMARVLPMFAHVAWWPETLMWIGALTAFLAATMALVEPDLKRVLAYSTVSQLGYMMFGLGLGVLGFAPATYHLMIHAVTKALLFLGAGAIIHAIGTRNMYEMGGLKKEMKLTYVTMLIAGLGLAGLIPLSGFWSKDFILAAAWDTGNFLPFALMIITGVLTAAYIWRMINLVFLGQSRRKTQAHDAPWQMSAPLMILVIGVVTAWLAIGFLTRAYSAFTLPLTFTVHSLSILTFILETFTFWWVAGLSLLAFVLGIGLFYTRKKYAANRAGMATIRVARQGYGFDRFYGGIVRGVRAFSMQFRKTHTGDLNYNLAGLVIGITILVCLVFFIFLGGA
jgi:NADH-quinone oxidoreductase subunit L